MATLTRRLFSVDEYHQMAEAGILREDDRIELIEGELIEMAPIGSRHNAAVDRLNELLVDRLQHLAIVRVQGSVRLNQRNEPQPDLVILRRREDFYETAVAGPGDTLLVIEVADSSHDFDREIKAPLYAGTGVPEFWLVDLGGRTITTFREPTTAGYEAVVVTRFGGSIAPAALPDVKIAIDEVMPGS